MSNIRKVVRGETEDGVNYHITEHLAQFHTGCIGVRFAPKDIVINQGEQLNDNQPFWCAVLSSDFNDARAGVVQISLTEGEAQHFAKALGVEIQILSGAQQEAEEQS